MFSAGFRFLSLVVAFTGAASLQAAVSVERSVGAAKISQVVALPATDLVVLDAGFEAGFRQGMVCSVTRDGKSVGELLLVDLRARVASALILDLVPGLGLQSGDQVVVKTVSTRK
jgi:hypothetical protein